MLYIFWAFPGLVMWDLWWTKFFPIHYPLILALDAYILGFPRSGHVEFVVDKMALGQVFSEYSGFSCHSSFHRLLHYHHHLSSGAGTIGQ
jgi:hypothetical protein